MLKQLKKRLQLTFNYSSGGSETRYLERGAVYRRLVLRLSGSITSATTGGSKATILRGDEWALVRRIELLQDGRPIRQFTGEQLRFFNLFYISRPRISVALGNNSASTSARAFDSCLILPLELVGGMEPKDTALPSALVSSLAVRITWGALTDMESSGGTLSSSSVKLDVFDTESLGDLGPWNGCEIYQLHSDATIASGVTKQITGIPVGDMYRGFLFHTTDQSSPQVDAECLGDITVRFGTDRRVNIVPKVLREEFLLKHGLGTVYLNANAGADTAEARPFISPGSALAGWVPVDFLDDQSLFDILETQGVSELTLEYTTSAAIGTLEVLAYKIIPIRGKAA